MLDSWVFFTKKRLLKVIGWTERQNVTMGLYWDDIISISLPCRPEKERV